jgi:hypothetical protein
VDVLSALIVISLRLIVFRVSIFGSFALSWAFTKTARQKKKIISIAYFDFMMKSFSNG